MNPKDVLLSLAVFGVAVVIWTIRLIVLVNDVVRRET